MGQDRKAFYISQSEKKVGGVYKTSGPLAPGNEEENSGGGVKIPEAQLQGRP